MKKIWTISLLYFLCVNSYAVVQFEIVFGGKGYDQGNCIIQTPDHGYVIVGVTSGFGSANSDIYLAKIDSAGVGKWQQLYGGSGVDHGISVHQAADKGFIVGGYTNGSGAGGYDFYLMKADSNGNWMWGKTFGGSDWDFGYCAKPTNDGGIIMCGGTYSFGAGNEDGYVVRTDADGNILWEKTFGGTNDDELKSIKQTTDGGFIATGITKSYGEVNGDVWMLKLDSAGNELWSKRFGKTEEDRGNDVIEINSGYILVGQTYSFGHGGDTYLVKTNTVGDTVWTELDGGDAGDYANSVVEMPNGKFAFAGMFITANGTGGGGMDFRYAIYDINGGWYVNGRTRGGLQDESCKSIIYTSDGGLAMVGETKSYGNGLTDIYIIKTDSMGWSTDNPVVLNYMSVEKTGNNSRQINVFPNPATDVLSVYIDAKDVMLLQIHNMLGEIVYQSASYQKNIDVSDWAKGAYFISLYTNSGESYSQKFIKD